MPVLCSIPSAQLFFASGTHGQQPASAETSLKKASACVCGVGTLHSHADASIHPCLEESYGNHHCSTTDHPRTTLSTRMARDGILALSYALCILASSACNVWKCRRTSPW